MTSDRKVLEELLDELEQQSSKDIPVTSSRMDSYGTSYSYDEIPEAENNW